MSVPDRPGADTGRRARHTRRLARRRDRPAGTRRGLSHPWVRLDAAGRLVEANAAFERVMGRSAAECSGRPLAHVFGWSPDAWAARHLSEAIARGHGATLDIDATAANGATRRLRVDLLPLPVRHGRAGGFELLAVDLTQEIRAIRHLRSVVDTATAGIVIQDAEGRIVDANPEAERLLGLTRDQMAGATNHDPRWHVLDATGEPLPAERQPSMVALRTGRPAAGVIGVETPDGARRWLMVSARRDDGADSGRPVVIASFVDVTADRERERAIAESERRLQAVIDGTRVGIWEWNVQTGEIVVNERWAEIIGYRLDEISPATVETWVRLAHPDDLAMSDAALEAHLGGETEFYEIECRMRHRDGHWVWVHDRGKVASRTPDGRPLLVAGTHQDITSRKADECALAENERRLQAVIEGTGAGTWEWEPGVDASRVNARWAEIIGYTLEEIGTLTGDGWLAHVHPEDRPRAIQHAADHFAGLIPGIDIEFRMLHRDGRVVWVHDRGRIVARDSDGNPALLAGTHTDITDRKLAEEALTRTNAQLQAAIENFPGGLTFVGPNLQMLGCNQRYRELLDLPDRFFENGLPNLADIFRFNAERGEYGPGDVEELIRERVERARVPVPHAFERTRPDGTVLEIRGMPMPDGGWVTGYLDVTERVRARELLLEKSRQLEETSRELQITLAHMNQGISVYDPDGRIVVWNMQYIQLFGMRMDDVQEGMTLVELLQIQKQRGNFEGDVVAYVETIAAEMAVGREYEAIARMKSGRVVKSVHSPRPDGGWVSTHEDITERERAAARIAHAAQHDLLTGLRNRVGWKAALEAAAGRAAEGSDFSILLVDLDRFKAVNDTFGHAVGDKLLTEVADRMNNCVRTIDVVSRLGGDEFAVLCGPSEDARETAVSVAARLLTTVSAPYDIDGQELIVGASIGVAVAPAHGRTADELMRNADAALYQVKANGRNAFRVFDDRLAAAADDRRRLEGDLRGALARGELELHYQPVVSIADRRTVAMEALLRWRHPERGLVDPDVFIPIAEQTGLIRPIGQWALARAIRDAAGWPAHVSVAVNVSPAQLGHRDMVDLVTRELIRTRLDPRRLEIEVTETVLLGRDNLMLADLHQLRGLDVRVALDDFGTGYASMGYLRTFPFDRVKIDRSFVEGLETSRHCAAIVCAVASLARSLGIETTAEGVETEEQFALLAAAGCGNAQGWLFGRARPAAELDFAAHPARGARKPPGRVVA